MLMEDAEVQLVGPPIAIGAAASGGGGLGNAMTVYDGALAASRRKRVAHECNITLLGLLPPTHGAALDHEMPALVHGHGEIDSQRVICEHSRWPEHIAPA